MNTEIDCAGTGVIALGQDELLIIRGGWGLWGIPIISSMIGGAILMVLNGWEDFTEGLARGWANALELADGR